MKSNEQTRAQRFVSWTLARCAQDPGFAACLRRADNPDTEHYALGALCVFGVDVENDAERLPFATVGAALCRRKSEQDGGLGLGAALRACCEDAEQGNPRLRRLLACDGVSELCRILRPMLSLVSAKGADLCHAALLDDLLAFRQDARRRRVKLRWAREYYRDITREDAPGGTEEA